jgi:hypothetical protein
LQESARGWAWYVTVTQVVRRLGIALAAIGIVMFVVGFLWLAVTGGSSCSGSHCFRSMWVLLPASVLAFVAGVLMASFAGRGFGHAFGPTSFAEVDTGRFRPGAREAWDDGRPGRQPTRWSRSWRNAYAAAGFGQLGFALLFVIAGFFNGDDRSTLFLTATGLAAIAVPFLFVARRAAQRDRLHEAGVDATARILGVQQTGAWLNNNPFVRLDLEVTVPGHPPYEVQHGEVVPQVLIGRLTAGTPLHLKVDRDHPSQFVIDWGRG